MVYQGPSRGCNSCRQRRKKCDGTRPSCMRCIKAGRVCGGWEHAASLHLRQYKAQNANVSAPFVSIARKCGMPKRVPHPVTGILPEDKLPSEISREASNTFALRAFFYNYCFISANPNLSRGYLSRLEPLALRLGPESELVKACEAVAFGGHGKPLNRPALVQFAEGLHQESLSSFAQNMEAGASTNRMEYKMIAMLLGLYQITMCSDEDYGNHITHAKGLAALMKISASPFALFGKDIGLFAVPAFRDSDTTLDSLLFSLEALWTRLESPQSSLDFPALAEALVALETYFSVWQKRRIPEVKATSVTTIALRYDSNEHPVGYWPGSVDTYIDLYVAGVWNVFRAARLLLGHLLMKFTSTIYDQDSNRNTTSTTYRLVEDIFASIPYHLTDNLPAFVDGMRTSEQIQPGKHLGGLLLMHPLYVVANLSSLGPEVRRYARRCLEWIGENHGLGQATLLARRSDLDREYLSSGLMLIWSGFAM
ncbi:hypothetical protein BDV96DRAFT_254873 [Lophiotrema nucula]|uniref:Zn(2)-C6 fungal-type domain-containing protein n=1 Tax=Lophiotrema nucula TaxID=690887 RepID=A0A6A5YP21_9PLEO|nr:hypothetical protein BDV96DRAFT_254873 [Lophiotrema nucula]